jgi:hypothetical protein
MLPGNEDAIELEEICSFFQRLDRLMKGNKLKATPAIESTDDNNTRPASISRNATLLNRKRILEWMEIPSNLTLLRETDEIGSIVCGVDTVSRAVLEEISAVLEADMDSAASQYQQYLDQYREAKKVLLLI